LRCETDPVRVLAIVHQSDAGPGVFAAPIEERGVELNEWRPVDGQPAPELEGYDAVLSFGGAMNAADGDAWIEAERSCLRAAIARGTPLLGVCLGAELVAEAAGGRVRRSAAPEIGWHRVLRTTAGAEDPLIGTMPESFVAFQWHSYEFELPPGATELARSDECAQAFVLGRTWAIQFHAEVSASDAELWIDDYRSDPDAVAIGIDPEALRAETRERMGEWSALGRRLCAGFIEAASGT
jgi:GMP synthase-like glutamine amidotransferase